MAIQLLNKIEKARSLKLPQNSQKLRKVVKLGKILLMKLVNDFFREIVGEISDNFLKI